MDRDKTGSPTPWTVIGRLSASNRIREAMRGCTSLAELGEAAAEQFMETFFADTASVSLIQGDEYRTLVNVGELFPGEVPFPDDEIYGTDYYPQATAELLAGRGFFSSVGVIGSLPESDALLAELDRGTCMGVPLNYDGSCIGEVFVTRPKGDHLFDASDVGLGMELSRQLGFLIGPALLQVLREDPEFWPSATAALDR